MEGSSSDSMAFAEVRRKAAILLPKDLLLSDEALQDWIWDNCQDELRRAITFKRIDFVVDGKEAVDTKDVSDASKSSPAEMPPTQEIRAPLPTSSVSWEYLVRLSREIRSLMICVMGMATVLKETTRFDGTQLESVDSILNYCNQLVDLIDDVLQFAALETVHMNPDITLTNLQETLNTVVTLSEQKADGCNVTIKTLYDSSVPEFVSTDGLLLQQILSHLLGYAIKFADAGTLVKLSLSTGSAREMDKDSGVETADDTGGQQSIDEIPDSKAGENGVDLGLAVPWVVDDTSHVLRCVVKAFGKGNDNGDDSKIFELLQRAKTVVTKYYEGTDLGLDIASRLATCLSGNISVKSKVGEWTEFSVEVPLREKPVDVESLARKLKHATIFFVGNNCRDYIALATLEHAGVHLVRLHNCEELGLIVDSKRVIESHRVCLCFMQENLYQQQVYKSLASAASCALLTFGPDRSVSETKCHFLSLSRTLPSVLLEAMVACVEVTPVRDASPKQRTSEAVLKSFNFDFSSVKALIAEDNAINQKVLMRMLRRLGIKQVDVVDDGHKAVECLSISRYDIVFLDNQMPVMDGIEACQEIKKQVVADGPGPEIVFVTADTSDEFVVLASNAGGNGFISKPFDIRAIESYFRMQSKLYRQTDPQKFDSQMSR